MKRAMLVGVVVCCVSFLTFAEEIRTKDGKSYDVILKVTKVFDNGFIAWASNVKSTETSHYGEIFVINMEGTPGDELSSVLYPTQAYKGGYAIYTPYLEVAVKKATKSGSD